MSYRQLADSERDENNEGHGWQSVENEAHGSIWGSQSPLPPPPPPPPTTTTGAAAQSNIFRTPRATHLAISIAAGTVMTLFGYEQGVFGGIIVGEDFLEYFHRPSPGMQGFVTSVYDLGCFAGALLTLVVGEKLGRKRMLIIFTIIMAIGIIMQTAAHSMSDLIWGRFVAGIGNGGNTATAPVWHVETSHPSAKGSAVVKEMAVNVLGFVISNFITLACSGLMTEAQWRFPLGIQLLFCIVILIMVPLLPESPRWLLARRRDADAQAVLYRLNEQVSEAEEEYESIRTSVKAEQAAQTSWAQLLRGGSATRRVVLGMLLQVAQQLSGINVLAYYLPVVLHRSVGLPPLTARLVATGNAVSFFLTTSLSIFFVDKIGRRPLLIFLAEVMAVAFLGVGIGVGIGDEMEPTSHVAGIFATAFIWLYFTAFSAGWISIPWLYPAEINSLRFRTKGAALATACDWLFNYVVVQTTPPGIHYLGWWLYVIYALCNAMWVPLVWWFVVETQGKSLEEMDRWFERNPGWVVDTRSSSSFSFPFSFVKGLGLSGDEDGKWRWKSTSITRRRGGRSLNDDYDGTGDREAMMRDIDLGSEDLSENEAENRSVGGSHSKQQRRAGQGNRMVIVDEEGKEEKEEQEQEAFASSHFGGDEPGSPVTRRMSLRFERE